MLSIILLLFIIIILLYILKKLLHPTINQFIAILISLFIIVFIINIEVSINAVINSSKLCFHAIFPTIFPFTTICNLLIYYDGISLYSKLLGPLLCRPLGLSKVSSFSLATSFICGYPLGAKYSSTLYELGYIKKEEYFRLANIASNCGPLFILGSIATAMMKNISYGYILLISNYLSVIFIGLFTKNKTATKSNNNCFITSNTSNNFGENFKNSIISGLNTTLSVCGFIIMFSIIIEIIKNTFSLPINLLTSLFLGLIEITNGCKLITASHFNIYLKLSLISFLCSFSGLSIISQCYSFLSKNKVPFIKYFTLKFLQGIISFFITFIISFIFIKTIPSSSIKYQSNSILLYIAPLFILLVPLLLKIIYKKLFIHTS